MAKQSSVAVADPTTEPLEASKTDRREQPDTAALAYQYWIERGCPEGSPEDDWYRAERELTTRYKAAASR